MARLSDNEITQLKTNVPLQALVESSGIALKKQGKDYYNPPTNSDKKSKHSYSKLVTICKKLEP